MNADIDFLRGGGELGALIRAKDWSETPVGPPETWPQSLRTTVSLCLASNFPINIIWGPGHTQIYNDGYRVCCGDAHPKALGEDYAVTWASAWPVIGESFERAYAGETMYLENQRMFLNRYGYLEETFFTFSHSPIRDESGGVGGLFHPVTETTATMLAERRTRALRDLSAGLGLAEDEAQVASRSMEVLSGFEFDLPFLLFYRLDLTSGTYRLAAQAGVRPGRAGTPAEMAPDAAEPWPFSEALATSSITEVSGVASSFSGEPCGPYPEGPDLAFVVPVAVPGMPRPPAVIVAGASPRLPMNEAYRSFFALLRVTIANAIATVRAREDERRRAEALAEIDRAKTAFFSNVSHEFRTPLTLLLGPLEETLARDAVAGDDRQRLTVAHRNGLRLLRLVNALLDFSRVEADRAQAVYEPSDLAALTAELASNFRSACERAGLRLVVDCPPLPEPVHVDRDMWEKIVLNLVSNAFKFTFDGEIAVSLGARNAAAELAVRDTGSGIAQEDLPRIFERFHRVENARARTHEGTGIGLALVQELVRLHGGTVEVASTLGRGTTFTVRIPFGTTHLSASQFGGTRRLASTTTRAEAFVEEALRWLPGAEPAVGMGAPEAAVSHPGDPRRPHVLLVDDNSDMRDHVRRILSPRYDVDTAADGETALAMLKLRRPDLLLADVMMPRLDGFALLKAVRATPALRDLPVVLLSARAGEEAKVEGLEAGADDYLVKPFSAQELLARVGSNLDMARVRREAAEAVRASEERFRALVTATSYAVYRMSPDWSEMRELRGAGFLSDTPASSRSWLAAYIDPDDQAQVWAAIEQAIRTKSVFELEHRVRRRDGSLGWTLSRAVPLFDTAGEIREWFGAASDITSRKRVEKALSQSEARLERVFETDAVGILFFDHDGFLIDANDVFLRMTGYAREEVRERKLHWRVMTPPEWVDESEAQMHALAATGRIGPYEKEYLRKDGTRSWMLFAGRDLGDGATVEFAIDINDRKRAEAALRRSEEELRLIEDLRLITDSMPVQVGYIDRDQRYRFVNAEFGRFFGVPRERLLGRTMREWLGERVYARLRPGIEAALSGKTVRFEDREPDKHGPGLDGWTEENYIPRVAADGTVDGFIDLCIDITDRKRREALATFLDELSNDIARLDAAEDIIQIVGARIGSFLRVSRCHFTDIDDAKGTAVIGHDWHAAGLGTIADRKTHRIADFLAQELCRAARRGEVIVVPDTRHDPRVDASSYATLDIRSCIVAPFLRDGQWRFMISVSDPSPRDWRDDEVDLVREVGARVWLRLERARADAALRESEERFRAVANLVPDLLWRNDRRAHADWYNRRWLEYSGQSMEAASGEGWLDVVHPDDRAASRARFRHAIDAGEPFEREHRIRRAADGTYRWFLVRAEPVRDSDGTIVQWFGAATDIHEQRMAIDALRESERRQRTLMAELQHRVNNVLALVRAVAFQTIENAASLADFEERFEGRLNSMARAQQLLVGGNVEEAGLSQLIENELSDYGGRLSDNVHIDGPDVRLRPQAVPTLAMAFHELAVNAVKHGALSPDAPEGHVVVSWAIEPPGAPGDASRLLLRWDESGVPHVNPAPPRRGQGRDLIEAALPHELRGASVQLEFRPHGARCTFDIPLRPEVGYVPATSAGRDGRDGAGR